MSSSSLPSHCDQGSGSFVSPLDTKSLLLVTQCANWHRFSCRGGRTIDSYISARPPHKQTRRKADKIRANSYRSSSPIKNLKIAHNPSRPDSQDASTQTPDARAPHRRPREPAAADGRAGGQEGQQEGRLRGHNPLQGQHRYARRRQEGRRRLDRARGPGRPPVAPSRGDGHHAVLPSLHGHDGPLMAHSSRHLATASAGISSFKIDRR